MDFPFFWVRFGKSTAPQQEVMVQRCNQIAIDSSTDKYSLTGESHVRRSVPHPRRKGPGYFGAGCIQADLVSKTRKHEVNIVLLVPSTKRKELT